MTTATNPRVADAIVPPCRTGLSLLEMALKEIPAEKFAVKPDGVETNHPAWIIGHLSIYTDNVIEMIGRGDLAEPDERLTELFKDGTECRNDPAGRIYPKKDELVARFVSRMNKAFDAVEQADEAVFAKPNTLFAQEQIPTVGGLVNFLLAHHIMMHFGQISAWRRMMGMGRIM